jgi:spore coat polysaccharide biosynthesis protein SpsF
LKLVNNKFIMKKKIVAITQARMGSTRLPGKVLKIIGNQTLLELHLIRAQKSQLISELILATTTESTDDVIIGISEKMGIPTVRGSESDVLDRYYQAAKKTHADIVVRVTSDCPLIDPIVMDKVIEAHLKNGADFTSNIVNRTYPDGMDVEVFNFPVLEKAWKEAQDPSDREHVTYYIWKNSNGNGHNLFTSFDVLSGMGSDYSNIRLTVDYDEDYLKVKSLVETFGPSCGWQEYCK